MGKQDKTHYKAKGHSGSFKMRKVINQGSNSTIQQINSAIGGSDKIYNGGSPIVFNAVKSVIVRAFKGDNVYQMIHYEPGIAAEDIVEDEFTLPEPTMQTVVDGVIANNLAQRAIAHQNAITMTEASGMPLNSITMKINDLNLYNLQQTEKINMERQQLTNGFNNLHQNWIKEQEKFEAKQMTLMKVFTRCFGLTTLTAVKQYIDNNRYRRAWFEICTQNAIAAGGQTNTAVLLKELEEQTYDASNTSFAAMESNLQLLEEQLIEHGEAVPTDDHRLYQLVKVLKTSPGNEFEHEINYAEMSALGYQEARLLFIRKYATIASNKDLKKVHNVPARNEHTLNNIKSKGKGGDKKDKKMKCTNCGKTNHYVKDCFFLTQECYKCGKKGHFAKDCTTEVMEIDDDSNKGDKVVDKSSKSFGSKFNKNSKAYQDDFLLTEEDHNAATSQQTDHLVGDKVACYVLLIRSTLCAMRLTRIILDSGASTHMLPKSMLCYTYRKSRGLVRLGDTENTLSIMGTGDTYMGCISDVLDVEGLLIGVLSVSRFDKIQFRTEFINGKGNIYDVHGQLVLTSSLQSDGMYLVDPQYVEYLMYGSKSDIEQVQRQLSCVSVHTTDTVLRNKEDLVKRSEVVSDPPIITGESTNTNITKVVQPWTLNSINGTSTNGYEELSTIPGSSGDIHPICTKTTASEGEITPSTGEDNLYVAHGAHTNHNIYTINDVTGLNPLDILHRQLGHVGEARIKSMVKSGAVKGCPYTWKTIKDLKLSPCKECLVGRMRAKQEGSTTDHPWKPLEKIAIDYKGDFARKALGGYKGFMLLVDYATNWVHADLVKNKSEHTRVLQDFKVNYTMK